MLLKDIQCVSIIIRKTAQYVLPETFGFEYDIVRCADQKGSLNLIVKSLYIYIYHYNYSEINQTLLRTSNCRGWSGEMIILTFAA